MASRVHAHACTHPLAQVYSDEPLTWPAADAYGLSKFCRLVSWRGACPGVFGRTMLPLVGGWSGFVKCFATSSRFRRGLYKAVDYVRPSVGFQQPSDAPTVPTPPRHYEQREVVYERTAPGARWRKQLLEGLGRRLGLTAVAPPPASRSAQGHSSTRSGGHRFSRLRRHSATQQGVANPSRDSAGDAASDPAGEAGGSDELPAVYLSTDSPALQTLGVETYPSHIVTIDGDPVPSWDKNRSAAEYAKVRAGLRDHTPCSRMRLTTCARTCMCQVLADFEMLRLCDVIAGPVSSNYAKTAARGSMITRGYLTQHGMCRYDDKASNATLPTPSLHRNFNVLDPRVPSLQSFERTRGVEGMFADCTQVA